MSTQSPQATIVIGKGFEFPESVEAQSAQTEQVRLIGIQQVMPYTRSSAEDRTLIFEPASRAVQTSPEVCGGEPCLAGTRITVRTLDQLFRQGESIEGLASIYQLQNWQVQAALDYAKRNREQIDEFIRRNEDA